MIKLSIILPVYNVQSYLRQCIDSILEQPFSNFELIIVNDGSTDDSGRLCEEYSQQDDRIKVFHKENGGLSSARNYGISKHKGKYLSFIDSDDYLVGDYYSKAIDLLDSNISLDMVWLQYAKMYDNDRIEKVFNKDEKFYTKGIDNDFLHNFCSKEAFAWLKVYRSHIFENIKYPEGQILEDLFIVPELFEKVRCFSIITMKGYYAYRQRQFSICHTKHTPKMLSDIALSYAKIIQLYKNNDRKGYIKTLATYSSGYLNALTLFPKYDYSLLADLYSHFDYTWRDIFSSSILLSQKIKLALLKIMGYKRLVSFYQIIYRIKH